MDFLEHRSIPRSQARFQWHLYRQLELIPETVPDPVNKTAPLATALNWAWRPLLGLLIDELVAEQRVEYLERCWALEEWGQGRATSSPLRRFWVLIS